MIRLKPHAAIVLPRGNDRLVAVAIVEEQPAAALVREPGQHRTATALGLDHGYVVIAPGVVLGLDRADAKRAEGPQLLDRFAQIEPQPSELTTGEPLRFPRGVAELVLHKDKRQLLEERQP